MDALHLHEFVDVVMGHICRQLEFDETYTGIGEDYKGGQPFGCSHLLCSCSCSDWRSRPRRFVYCSVHYCIVHLDLRLSGLQNVANDFCRFLNISAFASERRNMTITNTNQVKELRNGSSQGGTPHGATQRSLPVAARDFEIGLLGGQTQTRSGHTCQNWRSTTPHSHRSAPRLRGERPAGRAELLAKNGNIWAHAASAGIGTDP